MADREKLWGMALGLFIGALVFGGFFAAGGSRDALLMFGAMACWFGAIVAFGIGFMA